MQISKKTESGKLTLAIAGRLDTNTSPELEAEMNLDGIDSVVFDLANLEYISSAGLRILLGAKKTMMAKDGSMEVLNANATVKGVFDITGCTSIFGLS